MRCLLDESLPRRLKSQLVEHECQTVTDLGWSGIKNGKLLSLAAQQFDVFITADQNLQFQQNLSSLPIAVIVLVAQSNRLESLLPLLPALNKQLATLTPKTVYRLTVN